MERTESILLGLSKATSKSYRYHNKVEVKLLLDSLNEVLKGVGWILVGALSTCGIFDGAWGLMPYVLAWTFALNGQKWIARLIAFGGMLGLIHLDGFGSLCFTWLGLWILMEVLPLTHLLKKKSILIFLSTLTYPLLIIINRHLAFPLVTYFTYAFLAGAVFWAFIYSWNVLDQRGRVWNVEECLCLLLSTILLIVSLFSGPLFGFSLKNILLWQIVIVSGFLGGPVWGVVAGTFASLFCGCVRVGYILVLAGTLAGIITMVKLRSLLIGLLGVGLIFIDREFARLGTEILVSSIFLPITLNKVQSLRLSVPSAANYGRTESKAIELKARIDKFSITLAELSKVFAGLPVEKLDDEKGNLPALVEGIASKVCKNCIQQNLCWNEYFLITYSRLTDLLIDLESSSKEVTTQKNSLSWCVQPKEIVETAESFWKMRGQDILWHRRLVESKGVVANQLKGLANVVSDLGCQLDLLEKDKHSTDTIAFEMQRQNIKFDSIECCRFEHGLAISVSVPRKKGRCCDKEVLSIVNRAMGQNYFLEKHLCKEKGCELFLVPYYLYDVDIFTKRQPSIGYSLCGDSVGIASLSRGRHLLTLSDGMGVGPEAALQSSTVVSFIEKFISLDVSCSESLKLVNSVSFLSTEKETFATVDLALLDKYTGELVLSKLGSAPSFIKRGKKVVALTSNSLPVGMLSNIEIYEKRCNLRPRDLLVIVSDGVINEGFKKFSDQDWLERLLKENDGSAQEIGEIIFSMLPTESKDDLTVVVLELKIA